MGILDRFRRCAPVAVEPDGFGQSFLDDLRFLFRFPRARRRPVTWRIPTDMEGAAIEAHPVLGRFGDDTIGVADVDDERWIVRDRDWFGWPDPPQYIFFALADDRIRAAADFDRWPPRWTRPDYSIVTPTTFQSPPS